MRLVLYITACTCNVWAGTQQKCRQTAPPLPNEDHFYSLIQLSQFHLVNEGVGSRGGGGLPFRLLRANNHIETRGRGQGPSLKTLTNTSVTSTFLLSVGGDVFVHLSH